MGKLFLFTVAMLMLSQAQGASGITYHGRILRSDGSAVNGQFVGFRIRILAGDVSSCQLTCIELGPFFPL